MIGSTTPARPDNRRLTILAILGLIAASLVPIWIGSQMSVPNDDSFITMVYARSIMNGQGFRYFPTAPQTLGTTSPLEALLLAAVWKVLPFFPPEKLVIALSVVWWLLAGWLVAWRGSALGFSRLEAYCAGFSVLIAILPYPNQYLGLETRLFAFLLTSAAILYAQRRFFLAGVVSGLLFLARGEGILILGAFVGYELLTRVSNRTLTQRSDLSLLLRQEFYVVAGFSLIFVPWAIYAYATFGTFLSNTLAAKTFQVGIGFLPFWPGFVYEVVSDWSDLGALTIGPIQIGLWTLLGLMSIIAKGSKVRPYTILILWAFGFVLGYVVLNVPFYLWYPTPFLFVMTILAGSMLAFFGMAVAELIQRVMALSHYKPGKIAASPILMTGLFVVLAGCLEMAGLRGLDVPYVNLRLSNYQHISNWLHTHTPPGSRIGYNEVGILGWYADRQIVDVLGLTEPELIKYLSLDRAQQLLVAADLDYFVFNPGVSVGLEYIFRTAYFAEHYRLVATIQGDDPTQWPASLIYQRVSSYF